MEISKQEIWWVLRAQAGEREALDELFRLLQEPLYRYIVSLTGSRALAEDILQEVFILIYRKLRWLREPELFRSWAYRIAMRETFKHLKREHRWADQTVDGVALEGVPAPPRDALTPPHALAIADRNDGGVYDHGRRIICAWSACQPQHADRAQSG